MRKKKTKENEQTSEVLNSAHCRSQEERQYNTVTLNELRKPVFSI